MATEIKTPNKPLTGGKVRGKDKVTVYATKKLSATHTEGEAMEVHPALAEKLIASGKATKAEPKK
jgi:hypothetical protein